MNARRFSRTMQDAFGPYTSNDLLPMPEPREYSTNWWLAMCVVAVLASILVYATR